MRGRKPLGPQGTEPAVTFIDWVLDEAVDAGASDLHLSPLEEGYEVRLRVDGELVELAPREDSLPPYENVISRLKILARMNVAQRNLPQDGHFQSEVKGRSVDFRVAVAPALDGEAAVVRIFDRHKQRFSLDELGMGDDIRAVVTRALEASSGMLVVSGPIASGKTTTLYSILGELVARGKKVVTIEDPIEARIPGAVQMEVNERAGLTHERGLRTIVRHDPDVIMIGEIRDNETARLAVEAAVLGHLVLATIHAETAEQAVERLMHMDVDRYQLAVAFNAVLSQRLVRTLAGPGATTFEGRTAIFEVLRPSEPLKRRLLTGDGLLDTTVYGLWVDGKRKVAAGVTTDEEVRRVLSASRTFRETIVEEPPVPGQVRWGPWSRVHERDTLEPTRQFQSRGTRTEEEAAP